MTREEVIRLAKEAFGVEFISESDGGKLERFAQLVAAENHKPALEKYNRLVSEADSAEMTAEEKLRFFLSLALRHQDWLDVEPFLDAAMEKVK